jgi:hypothetical protein
MWYPDIRSIICGYSVELGVQRKKLFQECLRAAPKPSPTNFGDAMPISADPMWDAPRSRRRCGARTKNFFKRMPDGSVRSRSPFCQAWAMKGKARCRLHGGASTGPKSPEGKARVAAAMHEGRRQWIARLKAQGKKIPGGRKAGPGWITPKMRERQRAEAARRETERWAAMTPVERRFAEIEEQKAKALQAIEILRERLARTGSLRG